MHYLARLNAARQQNLTAMRGILDVAGAANRDLTAEEQAEFERLEAATNTLDGQIAREESVNRRMAAAATAVGAPVAPAAPAPGVSVQVASNEQPGTTVARITQALIRGGGNLQAAASFASHAWGAGFGDIVASLPSVGGWDNGPGAAMNTTVGSAGGFLIDTQYSSDFIELLRPRVAVRTMGAIPVPMVGGNLTMRKAATGTTAGYFGEGSNIPTTGMTVGQVTLAAKNLGALVPISNDLLQTASISVDRMVRNDLVSGISTREDQQFLRGVGSALAPAGLLNLALVGNKFDATDLAPLAGDKPAIIQAIDADLNKARLKLIAGLVPMENCGYIISARLYLFLEGLRDAHGNKAYPEIKDGKIGIYPFVYSTSVPDNLGAGTNESEIYFADFSQVLVGETLNVAIAVSSEAAYDDGGGMKSSFQANETLVRIMLKHDLDLRHDPAVAVIQKVKWGA